MSNTIQDIQKKQTIDTCNSFDRSQWNYAEWEKPVSKASIYIIVLK